MRKGESRTKIRRAGPTQTCPLTPCQSRAYFFGDSAILRVLPIRRKARCPIGTSRHVSPGQR
eukprot:2786260-Prymnesium_polylepis.1